MWLHPSSTHPCLSCHPLKNPINCQFVTIQGDNLTPYKTVTSDLVDYCPHLRKDLFFALPGIQGSADSGQRLYVCAVSLGREGLEVLEWFTHLCRVKQAYEQGQKRQVQSQSRDARHWSCLIPLWTWGASAFQQKWPLKPCSLLQPSKPSLLFLTVSYFSLLSVQAISTLHCLLIVDWGTSASISPDAWRCE